MGKNRNRLLVALLIGLVLAGAALILTLPALFGPHEPGRVILTMILGGITVVFAVGVLLMRPPGSRSVP